MATGIYTMCVLHMVDIGGNNRKYSCDELCFSWNINIFVTNIY